MNPSIVALFLCSIAFVECEPPSTYGAPSQSYGAPSGGGGGYPGGHGGGGNGYESNEPQSYEFGYRVKDDYSGSNFHQKESSDGNQVKGEYKVQLPDGRTQIVSYWADWATGFHADVRYEGQAMYPQNQPKGQYGAPAVGAGGGGYNYPSPSSSYGAPSAH